MPAIVGTEGDHCVRLTDVIRNQYRHVDALGRLPQPVAGHSVGVNADGIQRLPGKPGGGRRVLRGRIFGGLGAWHGGLSPVSSGASAGGARACVKFVDLDVTRFVAEALF